MTASVRIRSRCSKDYGKDAPAIPAVVQHHLRSRADRCSPEIQRGTSHPRRAGAPEGTAVVDGTGTGYGLRPSCGVGHVVRG